MKVKFLEPTFFEGKKYEKGETYNVKPEVAGALGDSVKILSKKNEEVEVFEEGVENENSEKTEPKTEKGKGKGKK